MPHATLHSGSPHRPQPAEAQGEVTDAATSFPEHPATSDGSQFPIGNRAYPRELAARPPGWEEPVECARDADVGVASGWKGVGTVLAAALGLTAIGADLSAMLTILMGVTRRRRGFSGAWRRLMSGLVLSVLVLAEGGVQSRQLHCQAIGFFAPFGESPRGECVAQELRAGRLARAKGTNVYNLRQRIQIHSLNLIMAAGGWLVGFEEVAVETAYLSLGGPTAPPLRSAKERLDRCHTGGDNLETVKGDATFLLASPRVRQMVAVERSRLAARPGKGDVRGKPQAIHWIKADSWMGLAKTESLRVALALEVPDSRLQVSLLGRERGAPRVGLIWTGTIRYPPDLGIRVGMAKGPQVWLSEAILCGAQADGALNPFRLHLSTELPADDPRLGHDGLPRRNTIEAVFHRVAHYWPTLRKTAFR